MALPTEEEKKRYTAFPHNPPPPGRVYGESQALGLTKPKAAQPAAAFGLENDTANIEGQFGRALGAVFAPSGTPDQIARIRPGYEAKPVVAAPPSVATATPQMLDPLRVQEARNGIAQPSSVTAPAMAPRPATGMGITRIDKPGATPLFTNLAADDPSNASLMARGPISAQNMGTADALSNKYRQEALAAIQKESAPTGPNSYVAPDTGGFGILDKSYQRERSMKMAASDSRNSNESRGAYASRIAGASGALQAFQGEQTQAPRLAAAQRGLDARTQADAAMAQRRMLFDEAQGSARLGLDRARLTDETQTNAMRRQAAQSELDTKAQLDAARQEYMAAGDDPAKQKAAARKLAVLTGKGEDAGDQIKIITAPATTAADGFTQIPGGQRLVRIGRDGTVSDITPQQGQQDQSQKQPYKKGELYTRTQGGKDVKVEFAGYDPVTGKEQWKSF